MLKLSLRLLTSDCTSCIICLMLSYFFSLTSYFTDNSLIFYHNHGNLDITLLVTMATGVTNSRQGYYIRRTISKVVMSYNQLALKIRV